MKKFFVFLFLSVILTACTVHHAPQDSSRSIERSNQAMQELDRNAK